MAKAKSLKQKVSTLMVTCCGLGFFPKFPGTVASLASIPFWIYIVDGRIPVLVKGIICIVLTLISVVAVRSYERRKGSEDASEIVVDEWVGMGIALLSVEYTFLQVSLAFVLFRFFDILKPIGVRYFDKNHMNGWGVMLDDVLAGIYVCICMGGFRYLLA